MVVFQYFELEMDFELCRQYCCLWLEPDGGGGDIGTSLWLYQKLPLLLVGFCG